VSLDVASPKDFAELLDLMLVARAEPTPAELAGVGLLACPVRDLT
jgi:hypothetical protein